MVLGDLQLSLLVGLRVLDYRVRLFLDRSLHGGCIAWLSRQVFGKLAPENGTHARHLVQAVQAVDGRAARACPRCFGWSRVVFIAVEYLPQFQQVFGASARELAAWRACRQERLAGRCGCADARIGQIWRALPALLFCCTAQLGRHGEREVWSVGERAARPCVVGCLLTRCIVLSRKERLEMVLSRKERLEAEGSDGRFTSSSGHWHPHCTAPGLAARQLHPQCTAARLRPNCPPWPRSAPEWN